MPLMHWSAANTMKPARWAFTAREVATALAVRQSAAFMHRSWRGPTARLPYLAEAATARQQDGEKFEAVNVARLMIDRSILLLCADDDGQLVAFVMVAPRAVR